MALQERVKHLIRQYPYGLLSTFYRKSWFTFLSSSCTRRNRLLVFLISKSLLVLKAAFSEDILCCVLFKSDFSSLLSFLVMATRSSFVYQTIYRLYPDWWRVAGNSVVFWQCCAVVDDPEQWRHAWLGAYLARNGDVIFADECADRNAGYFWRNYNQYRVKSNDYWGQRLIIVFFDHPSELLQA